MEAVRFIAVAVLFAACAILPTVVAARVNPWLGVVSAAAGWWVWGRLVPPSPGLMQGTVCVGGHAAILWGFILCVFLAICA